MTADDANRNVAMPRSNNNNKSSADSDTRLKAAPVIVGIGVSSTDIQSLDAFMKERGTAPGSAIIVVLHRRGSAENVPPISLQDRTLVTATDGMAIEESRTYLAPSNAVVTVSGNRLSVKANHSGSIDSLLVSIAEQQRNRAIGVILSDVGSDGTLGLTAIREHGGLTLAEQGPEPADVNNGNFKTAAAVADVVLPPKELAARLRTQILSLGAASATRNFDELVNAPATIVARIAAVLRNRTGHDFHGYKHNTFMRRVQRRMQVTQAETVDTYLELLRTDPEEATNLFNDLLIGVTHFFRDTKEFEFLEREVIPRLFEGKQATDHIRIWVLGCATGEEAYSIAILLREHMARLDIVPHVQIFATDIDNRALSQARIGRYAASAVKDVTPERLARWFVKEGETYCVVKELREMCLFSQHNLTKDAPFSRLDLVSCRNLLIYLGPELQNRVIPLFHFALKSGGYLFLGNSENVSRHGKLFAPVDRRFRVFRQIETMTRLLPDFPLAAAADRNNLPVAALRTTPNNSSGLTKQAERIMERYAPAYMIVDENHEVLHFSGRTGRFIDPPSGHASLNVFSLIHRDLRVDLRASLHKVENEKAPVRINGLKIGQNGTAMLVTLSVEPIELSPGQPQRYVIILQDGQMLDDEEGIPVPSSAGQDDHVRHLEDELRQARDRLQATVEELESTNEELKASNEEYQSVNEELQSSNEELETSKEELQSLNEELQTVNGELAHRVEELARANSDLRNLLESTQIAAVFLDNELRIKSFTPAITDIFHLIETDLGRPIHHIAARIAYEDLEQDTRRVIRTLSTIERETKNLQTGAHYLVRVLPYRSVDNVIEGAVLTFLDVTALVAAEERLRDRESLLRSVVEGIPQLVWRAVGEGNWTWCSPQWTNFTGQTEAAALRRGWLEAVHPDDRSRVLNAWQAAESNGVLEVEHRLLCAENLEYRTVHQKARPVINDQGKVVEWFGTATDIHEMRMLQQRQEFLLHELQHRVRNTLAIVRSIAERTGETSESVKEYAEHLQGRINSLARTQALLTRGADVAIDLSTLINAELNAQAGGKLEKVTISGTPISLVGRSAENVGLVVHELTSNAVKHGALSRKDGRVDIRWDVIGQDENRLRFVWKENGTDKSHSGPARRGFGTELIEDLIPYQLGGSGSLEIKPEEIRCTIEVPLSEQIRLAE